MRKNSFVTLFVVAITSCACGIILKDKIIPDVFAQDVPVISKSTGHYSECFGASMWLTPGRSLNDGRLPKKTVKVPEGWTVVGGGSSKGKPVMILCR